MVKKIVIQKAGGYDQLQIITGPDLKIENPNDVLIQVKYSGVNYADCLVRLGVYASAKEYVGWPITPGFEVSGTVLAVGSQVTKFKAGDQVIGFTRFNGYSSQVTVPEEQVLPMPPQFNLAQGASYPSVYATAQYCLNQIFYLYPGSRIFVHSAAGGVGSALIQLAKLKGHYVVGVVGHSSKVEYTKALGCDEVLDKSATGFSWEKVKDKFKGKLFDAVYDANGFTTLNHSYDLVRSTGKLVVYGSHSLVPKSGGKLNYIKAAWGLLNTPKFDAMKMITDNKSLICFNVSFLFEEKSIVKDTVQGLIEASAKIKPPKVTVFKIEDVVKAHQLIESGMSTGKIVLEHS
jgi:NADPH:quinone reductase-like Zn-dependent oxidoreductase